MKKIVLLSCLFIALNAFAAKPTYFTLHCHVTDVNNGYIFIRNLTKTIPDTIRFSVNEFRDTIAINEVTPFVVTDESNKYQLFFAAPGDHIEINLKRAELQITSLEGSASQDIFRRLLEMQQPTQQAMDELQQAIRKPDVNRDSVQRLLAMVGGQRNTNFYNFLKENGESEVCAFLVYSSITNEHSIDANVADSMFRCLKPHAKASFFGVETAKLINKLKAVTVGYMAPDFTLPDSTEKKTYTLSGFRGKYLLVDFWASWCGPCKAEIPFMKEAYAKYHDSGFEIMSVSLDDKREAWLNALKQFQMPWAQVSDVKGFRSTVNELYPIPSIPKTLLLDKTGKIIATDLRGQALDLKLEQLLHQ